MPVDKKRYPASWAAISQAIREREQHKCKWCGAPNGMETTGASGKPYRIVLTVAHLGVQRPDGSAGDKRDKCDCRPDNLAALCQPCHLRFDIDEHVENARATRRNKQRQAALQAGQMEMFA